MMALMDTSSLMALTRYYIPFDSKKVLFELIEKKITTKEILILDRVHNETAYFGSGVIQQVLPYIKNNSNVVKTKDILPDAKFLSMLENNFCNSLQKSKISDVEFESEKKKYIEVDADIKLILFGLKECRNTSIDKLVVVTEESRANNDGKVFKKIPAICDTLGIETCTISEYLNIHLKVEINYSYKE